jgi:hypothetical protein
MSTSTNNDQQQTYRFDRKAAPPRPTTSSTSSPLPGVVQRAYALRRWQRRLAKAKRCCCWGAWRINLTTGGASDPRPDIRLDDASVEPYLSPTDARALAAALLAAADAVEQDRPL